jgi:hypothetical protein
MPGKVMRSPLEPLKNVARTLCAYRSLLLNHFQPESNIPAASSRASITR